jgi:energy-coupling factor transport system ATP-binding protein
MADKVIVMNKGEIVLKGTPKEIFDNQEILKNASLDVLTSMKLINKIEENPLNNQKEIVDLLWQLTYEM